jgi:hypothetical protein
MADAKISSVVSLLADPATRELARVQGRERIEAMLKDLPVQPAYTKAVANRSEKALNRWLHELGLPQVGTEIYKPAGRKAG